MTRLVWDQAGQHFFEVGVDHGVIYLADNTVEPWNGLTGVAEDYGNDGTSPYFLDGVKYLDAQSSGDYAATLTAITYPDSLPLCEGEMELAPGVLASNQEVESFTLSYRTQIGDDLVGTDLGYKLHIVYNVTAVPDAQTYATQSATPAPMEFSWKISAIPEQIAGYKPTAHVILDSRYVNPYLLQQLEEILYGSDTTDPSLPALADLISLILPWYLITIVDNQDGTWTATAPPEFITMLTTDEFQITGAAVTYLDADTYQIISTDTPQLQGG